MVLITTIQAKEGTRKYKAICMLKYPKFANLA